MKIEILGKGCSKCKKTKETIDKVVKQTGVDAEVVKVEDIEKIMSYGVMITPAVVVDGEVKLRGCLKIQNASTFGLWALLILNLDRKLVTSDFLSPFKNQAH